jgi:hypothetical protein
LPISICASDITTVLTSPLTTALAAAAPPHLCVVRRNLVSQLANRLGALPLGLCHHHNHHHNNNHNNNHHHHHNNRSCHNMRTKGTATSRRHHRCEAKPMPHLTQALHLSIALINYSLPSQQLLPQLRHCT